LRDGEQSMARDRNGPTKSAKQFKMDKCHFAG
jgi:hypothetical protein